MSGRMYNIMRSLPVLGICGHSGAGKTTLVESLVLHFSSRNARVVVIKNDVHGLSIDKEGKDSDRFFRAGADVYMRGPEQSFLRSHSCDRRLSHVVAGLVPECDLIFLEGHKSTPLFDKIWLTKEDPEPTPSEAENVVLKLTRDEDRLGRTLAFLEEWIPMKLQSIPTYLGVISQSPDQGVSTMQKQLRALADSAHEVVLLGNWRDSGSFSTISPVPGHDILDGAILAARRWQPLVNWVFATKQELAHHLGEIFHLLHLQRSSAVSPGLPPGLPAFLDLRSPYLPQIKEHNL